MANEYLKRTPTSTGNRKVWTWSGWVKLNKAGGSYRNQFFAASNDSANATYILFEVSNSDQLRIISATEGVTAVLSERYVGLFRDCGNWFHLIVSINTTNSTQNDRVKIYLNGVKVNKTITYAPSDNTEYNINNDVSHYIGSSGSSLILDAFKGEMSDVFLVDGQALTPDVFGFYKDGKGYQSSGTAKATDFRPGQWSPHSPRIIKSEINRRGGFGVNGFYLPMNDSSNFGADFHCDPNSIIALKGEDLPQPRNGLPTTSDNYVSQLRSDPYAANLVLAVPGLNTQPTGSELITNGTFDTNVSGWTITDTGTIVRQSDGTAKVTRGSSAEVVYQDITTVVGTTYELSVDITDIGGSHGQVYVKSTYHSGSINTNIGYSFYTGTYKGTFTADTTTTRIILYAHTSGYTSYDNVSVKATTIPDYSADIKGSGTNKTLTPAGTSGIRDNDTSGSAVNGYYGSAMTFNGTGDDAIFVPASSDINLTGDFTIEYWAYVDSNVTYGAQLSSKNYYNGSNLQDGNFYLGQIHGGNLTIYSYDGQSSGVNLDYTIPSGARFGQWQHMCFERHGNTMSTYLNGVAVAVDNNWTRGLDDASNGLYIGKLSRNGGTSDYGNFDGKIQDLRIYSGIAKYKGGFDVPKPYSPIGIESWRQVSDTCKNNFCTMDPLHSYTVKRNTGAYVATILNFTEGNLNVRNSGNAGLSPQMAGFSSFGMDSGKWYWELSNWENPANERFGISLGREQVFTQTGNGAAIECMLQVAGSNGQISSGGNHNGTAYEYLVSGTIDNTNATAITSSSDVVGLAFDRDNMAFYVYTNGTLTASITNITTSKTKVSTWFATKGNNSSASSSGQTYNFGQNPTFGGTATAGTYTDSNGKGLFKYQPPAGYLALCEDNLPTPAIADPGEHFKTVLYTGNGSARGITGVGFKPDFVWIKNRDSAYQHQVYDSVRGAAQKLLPSTTNAEVTDTANLSSFDSNGFSFAGGNVGVNQDTKNHVAWCWKAGGAAVSNTDGSINSQVSVNQTAGFSIVSYTGNGSSGTVGHGLGKTPNIVLVKNRIDVSNWSFNGNFGGLVYGTNKLRLQHTDGITSDTNEVTSTNATTFTIGNSGATNGSSDAQIAYCWAEIPGYSKFSSYQGTGQTDGPFIWCGFKPAFLMIKRTDTTGEWWMYDSSRGPTNPIPRMLMANNTSVEQEDSASYLLDFLSNGFKIRAGLAALNGSVGSFIFMAFAESPFQTANAK